METECTTTKKEIKLIVEYVYMYKIYIYIYNFVDRYRLYAQESCFIMQKFLLITTLDNSKEWPFAQYHETAALQSLYRHAIKVNIKKVFKLETPMIVRHCVSMFNESTGGEGDPSFSRYD